MLGLLGALIEAWGSTVPYMFWVCDFRVRVWVCVCSCFGQLLVFCAFLDFVVSLDFGFPGVCGLWDFWVSRFLFLDLCGIGFGAGRDLWIC